MTKFLVDTGPLVAYLRESDANHEWVVEQLQRIPPPLLTCEPVLAETAWLIGHQPEHLEALWSFMRKQLLCLAFQLETEFELVAGLMKRYSDIPMDLADACLVRMSELNRNCKLITTDSDFRFYRRFNRQVIPVIAPW
jgi:predicted nucleic acid-binding protein